MPGALDALIDTMDRLGWAAWRRLQCLSCYLTRLNEWPGVDLEEHARRSKYDQDEPGISQRKNPSTATIDPIAKLVASPLVQRAHNQIDDDCRAHGHKTESQEGVHQSDIGDTRQDIAHHQLIGHAGQYPDERNADPIAKRRSIHPEHREREKYNHKKGKADQSADIEGLPFDVNADD